MKSRIAVLLLGLSAAAILSGCSSSAGENEAIRGAIDARVAAQGNLNPSAFDTELQKVTINGDQAQADVMFRVKGGSGTMQLGYTLKKTAGQWAVVESHPMGGNPDHPSADGAGAAPGAATPDGMPDIDAIHRELQAAPRAPQTQVPGK